MFASIHLTYCTQYSASFCNRPTTIPEQFYSLCKSFTLATEKFCSSLNILNVSNGINSSLDHTSASCSSCSVVPPFFPTCPRIICPSSWNRLNQNLSASLPLAVNPTTILFPSINVAPCKMNLSNVVKIPMQLHFLQAMI